MKEFSMSNTPRRSSEEWQYLVDKQSQSDLTQKRFCEAHGVTPATFSYWKRKLVTRSSNDTESAWLDLSSGLNSVVGGENPHWKIQLDLGNGIVLRLDQQG
jgi:hypothetical protein